jgi:Trk-type K+ transport system membrane component
MELAKSGRSTIFPSMPVRPAGDRTLITTDKLITELYIVVGRNSHFHDLTKEEHDELGGVEYRSLRILFWLVLAVSCLIFPQTLTMTSLTQHSPLQYYILCPLIGFIIVGPYIRAGWDDTLRSDVQYRYVPPLWFSAFQMWSAFSNTGMSLNDLSMIPYQKAYPMIFVMVFLIFAGNTAFPIL